MRIYNLILLKLRINLFLFVKLSGNNTLLCIVYVLVSHAIKRELLYVFH